MCKENNIIKQMKRNSELVCVLTPPSDPASASPLSASLSETHSVLGMTRRCRWDTRRWMKNEKIGTIKNSEKLLFKEATCSVAALYLLRVWASSLVTTPSVTARPHLWGVHPEGARGRDTQYHKHTVLTAEWDIVWGINAEDCELSLQSAIDYKFTFLHFRRPKSQQTHFIAY